MLQKIAKKANFWLGVIAVGLVAGLGIQFGYAWTEPSFAPPQGNIKAPITTGGGVQSREGSLILNTQGNPAGLTVHRNLIVNNGSVGIGTTSPEERLQVVGGILSSGPALLSRNSFTPHDDSIGNGFIAYNSSDFGGITLLDRNGIAGGDDSDTVIFWGDNIGTDADGPNSLIFAFADYNDNRGTNPNGATLNERMRMTWDGSLGIGTTRPDYKLDVAGDIRGTRLCIGSDCRSAWPAGGITSINSQTGPAITLSYTSGLTSTTASNTVTASLNIAGINTAACTSATGTGKLYWDTTNNRLGCGTDQTGGGGTGGVTGSGTLNYVPKWSVSTTNLANSQIFDNGTNVGVGTATPDQKLHVNGNVRILGDGTNSFYFLNAGTQRGWFGYNNSTLSIYSDAASALLNFTSNGLQANTNILTSGLGAMPNSWSGIHTYDVHARNNVRANMLCLGGGNNSSTLGTCRTTWPGTTTTVVTANTACGAYNTAICPTGTILVGGGATIRDGSCGGGSLDTFESKPSGNGWYCGWDEGPATCYAICLYQ